MKAVLTVVGALLLVAITLLRVFAPPLLDKDLNAVKPHAPYPVSSAAAALHRDLFIVDLHSDSLLWDRDLLEESDYGQMDLPRLHRGNVGLQVFSATTKSPTGQNYESNEAGTDTITVLAMVQGWPFNAWFSLYGRAEFQLEKLLGLVDDSGGAMRFIRSKSDLETLLAERAAGKPVVGAMYLIEGAHPLEGEIDNLDRLHAQGLHFVGLTHFFDNRIGGSLHGVSGAGLTAFGRKVVQRADALGMNIDVAHASPQMVRDVLALTERPVILSHGGFKGHCDTPRNLDDALMQAIAAQGGIIGVGYWDATVCDDSPLGVVRAIRYGVELMGLDHIALGSDFDGTVITTFDTSELAALTQAMLDEGFSEDEIRAVMGGNMRRYLLAQLP